ncbi:response regulator [Bacillus sp. Marseille-Q1617]|uniref:response regulator transcription factor n=1 Tax=Bacillus sp. Marseille-Q1617 TaxID=2736887 RepID=UPI001589FBA1|nr:response regulator [Bacillus sp. Marseille-Q1617]
MKALIVDDERNVRNVLRQLGEWERLGITEIFEAANGVEALGIIKKEAPDIIFTDIKMPKMTGMELIEEINQLSFKGKIILVTGYDDYTFMRKAIQLNSFDYLLKPIEEEAFQAVLEKVVKAVKQEAAEGIEKGEILEEAMRLRGNQIMTAICSGETVSEDTLVSLLPDEREMDMTLVSFYGKQRPEIHIEALDKELRIRKIGRAFTFLDGDSLCIVITAKDQWLYVEEWMSENMTVPVRLVQDKLDSPGSTRDVYEGLSRELEQNQYRTIRRPDEMEAARRIQELVSYVETYYMEDISLEKLSKMFFLTREHISRTFKKETGMTLSKFVTKIRIEQAKSWLMETEESIYSISTMLGYQDEKYFSKLFKKVTGLTPFEYRSSGGSE